MSTVALRQQLDELRLAVTHHPLFSRTWSIRDLRLVMEHHVFAVWDFMSLAKALQRGLTCIENPWLPPNDPMSARLINEIIVAEESDCIESLNFIGSHFELYRNAMDEVGADTSAINQFIASLSTGASIAHSLESSCIPVASQHFVLQTLSLCQKQLHEVAAAFLFGREDVIPEMFQRILPILPRSGCEHFRAYLERHIDIDQGAHAPMAARLLENLCRGTQTQRLWREAADAAVSALQARRNLWNGLLEALDSLPRSSEFIEDCIPTQEQSFDIMY
jgi:hypothetical protein